MRPGFALEIFHGGAALPVMDATVAKTPKGPSFNDYQGAPDNEPLNHAGS